MLYLSAANMTRPKDLARTAPAPDGRQFSMKCGVFAALLGAAREPLLGSCRQSRYARIVAIPADHHDFAGRGWPAA
jgi:hypothetical protein